MKSNKKQSQVFNDMIGQSLDLKTISETFKGAVHVIEPGDETSAIKNGETLHVFVDEMNRVNGFSLPQRK